MKEKIRFSVIGLGHIGKLHANIIAQHKQAALVAVCDNSFVPSYSSSIPSFSSLESLLSSDVDFDVLCVATPNGLHQEQALLALRAGKHVVIEKPMALSATGCRKIIDMATTRQLQVFCVMQNRYSIPSLWLKDILEKGILGKIYMVNVSCFWNRDSRYYTPGSWHGSKSMDGGPLFTQFSHFIDTLLWLFGDIQYINSRFANFNHSKMTEFEDSGTVVFDFKTGARGCVHYTTACWDRNLSNRMTIIAENGSIEIEGQYMENISYCHIKNYDLLIPKQSFPPNYSSDNVNITNHHLFFDDVIMMLNSQPGAAASGTDGLKTVQIIEDIYFRP